MKTKINPVLLALLLVFGCAPEISIVEADVPQAVLDAFQSKYNGATEVEWEIEKEEGRLIYEAEFKQDGKTKEAEFKPDGTFLKEE